MSIAVVAEGKKWIIRSAFEEKDIVKAAGARWDPKRRTWWTDKPEVAEKLGTGDTEAIVAQMNAARDAQHAIDAVAIDASKASAADIVIPAPAGLDYLPYQKAGIAYGMARPGVLIGDEMGLGKTIQALGIINSDPSIRRALIVCPASLKLNWFREAKKWLVRPMRAAIANGKFPPADLIDLVVINYEQLSKHAAAIRAQTWDILISDEVHYLKNPKAIRTKQVFGAPKADKTPALPPIQARRRVFLTGTPIVNRPIELWPLVQSLDPKGLGSNWWNFAKRYCAAYNSGYGMDVSGSSNLDELQAKLRASIMVRRLKKDVLTDLPPKRRQIIALAPATPEERAALEAEDAQSKANEDRMEALRAAVEISKASDDPADYERAVEALSEAARAAFTEMSKTRHRVALAKLPQVIAHIQDAVEETCKIIVMAHHHDVIDGIMAAFPNAVKLDGTMDMASRQASVDRFQNDPKVGPFVGSIMAAGVGTTLTASSHVVFAELDWVPGNLSQAEDRAHRIGQVNSVLVQHIVLDGSLDATMAQRIVEKQDVIDRALDRDGKLPEAEHIEAPTKVEAATQRTSRAQVEAEAFTMTPAAVAAVHAALRTLSAMCDGAHKIDGMGFNKLDTRIGKDLAARERLTPKQAVLGKKIATKYRRQLSGDLVAQMAA